MIKYKESVKELERRFKEGGTQTRSKSLKVNIFENKDCLEGMAEYPDKHFDLAIVDPPYRDENKPTKWMKDVSNMECFGIKPPKQYFDELFRVSKNQIIWGANNFNLDFPGFIIWDKGIRGSERYSWFEIASLSKELSTCSKLCKIHISEKGYKIHPTQKPIKLYKWLLQNYAKEGDLILDTHVGSASSLIACIELGFDYVGFELDPDYYKAAQERIKQFEAQTDLFRKPAGKDGAQMQQAALFQE